MSCKIYFPVVVKVLLIGAAGTLAINLETYPSLSCVERNPAVSCVFESGNGQPFIPT